MTVTLPLLTLFIIWTVSPVVTLLVDEHQRSPGTTQQMGYSRRMLENLKALWRRLFEKIPKRETTDEMTKRMAEEQKLRELNERLAYERRGRAGHGWNEP